jgi:hypothetical protein
VQQFLLGVAVGAACILPFLFCGPSNILFKRRGFFGFYSFMINNVSPSIERFLHELNNIYMSIEYLDLLIAEKDENNNEKEVVIRHLESQISKAISMSEMALLSIQPHAMASPISCRLTEIAEVLGVSDYQQSNFYRYDINALLFHNVAKMLEALGDFQFCLDSLHLRQATLTISIKEKYTLALVKGLLMASNVQLRQAGNQLEVVLPPASCASKRYADIMRVFSGKRVAIFSKNNSSRKLIANCFTMFKAKVNQFEVFKPDRIDDADFICVDLANAQKSEIRDFLANSSSWNQSQNFILINSSEPSRDNIDYNHPMIVLAEKNI